MERVSKNLKIQERQELRKQMCDMIFFVFW
jgi:hypothetical protein